MVVVGEKPYSCTICDACFTQQGTLKEHLISHTGKREYKCEMCAKSYLRKRYLMIHMRTHLNIMPYSCTVCPKRFARRDGLTRHLQTHAGVKAHVCVHCEKGYARRYKLREHMENVHNIIDKNPPLSNGMRIAPVDYNLKPESPDREVDDGKTDVCPESMPTDIVLSAAMTIKKMNNNKENENNNHTDETEAEGGTQIRRMEEPHPDGVHDGVVAGEMVPSVTPNLPSEGNVHNLEQWLGMEIDKIKLASTNKDVPGVPDAEKSSKQKDRGVKKSTCSKKKVITNNTSLDKSLIFSNFKHILPATQKIPPEPHSMKTEHLKQPPQHVPMSDESVSTSHQPLKVVGLIIPPYNIADHGPTASSLTTQHICPNDSPVQGTEAMTLQKYVVSRDGNTRSAVSTACTQPTHMAVTEPTGATYLEDALYEHINQISLPKRDQEQLQTQSQNYVLVQNFDDPMAGKGQMTREVLIQHSGLVTPHQKVVQMALTQSQLEQITRKQKRQERIKQVEQQNLGHQKQARREKKLEQELQTDHDLLMIQQMALQRLDSPTYTPVQPSHTISKTNVIAPLRQQHILSHSSQEMITVPIRSAAYTNVTTIQNTGQPTNTLSVVQPTLQAESLPNGHVVIQRSSSQVDLISQLQNHTTIMPQQIDHAQLESLQHALQTQQQPISSSQHIQQHDISGMYYEVPHTQALTLNTNELLQQIVSGNAHTEQHYITPVDSSAHSLQFDSPVQLQAHPQEEMPEVVQLQEQIQVVPPQVQLQNDMPVLQHRAQLQENMVVVQPQVRLQEDITVVQPPEQLQMDTTVVQSLAHLQEDMPVVQHYGESVETLAEQIVVTEPVSNEIVVQNASSSISAGQISLINKYAQQ